MVSDGRERNRRLRHPYQNRGLRAISRRHAIYFTAPDIEGTLAKVNANGGRTLIPRTSIGEYGFIAHFEDSEGNRLALHSRS